jgi:hypothetical protein
MIPVDTTIRISEQHNVRKRLYWPVLEQHGKVALVWILRVPSAVSDRSAKNPQENTPMGLFYRSWVVSSTQQSIKPTNRSKSVRSKSGINTLICRHRAGVGAARRKARRVVTENCRLNMMLRQGHS